MLHESFMSVVNAACAYDLCGADCLGHRVGPCERSVYGYTTGTSSSLEVLCHTCIII